MKNYWINLLTRSVREGTLQLWRHRFLTLTTIFLGVLILLLLNFVFAIQYYTQVSLENLQARADFTIPLEVDYNEFDLQALENSLDNDFDVSTTVLPAEDFGTFGVPDRLQVRFNDLREIQDIFERLKSNRYSETIGSWENIGERDFVTLVDRLLRLKDSINTAGTWLVGVFLIGGVLLVINAFWVGLFTRKNEVFIARLVGADSLFIAGPILWEGVLIGLISSVLAIVIFIGALTQMQFWPSAEIFGYMWANVFSYEILVSIFVGVLGAWLAVRRYLVGRLDVD